MQLIHTRTASVVAFALALALSACSSESKRPEYYNSLETSPLEVPQGLSEPDHSAALVINTAAVPPSGLVMETKPPRISSTTSGVNSNSRLSWSARGLYLTVKDTPESVHRRLGLVIERAGMQRIRIDDKGVYRFDYYQDFNQEEGFFSKLAFWRGNDEEDYSGAYQAFTEPDGEDTRVYIKYADGTDCEPDAAEHLLAVIEARLG